MKTNEKKQIKALEDLKPKGQTNAIVGKSNDQLRSEIIFNDLINKRKKIMSELHDNVDNNKSYFEYVGPTKDVSVYEYMDFKEICNKLKHNHIRFNK